METIGFIGGGRMAEALINGICSADLVERSNIYVSEPVAARRLELEKELHVTVCDNAGPVLQACRTVVLAVKPQVVATVLNELAAGLTQSHLLISIAAGISTDVLHRYTGSTGCRLIRVMPNTPALVQEGAAGLCAGPGALPADLDTALTLFQAVGTAVVLDEALMDAVTGLSGSGPAYVFAFLEAMTMAGINCGLSRDAAEQLARSTIIGSVRLAEHTGRHPAELAAMVTSPGGTTIAGLHVLEKGGFKGMVMDAVAAATRRSRELGQ